MKRFKLLAINLLAFVSISFAQEMPQLKLKMKNGSMYLASEDEAFKFTFGGRVFMDAASYFDDKTDLASGAEFRDLRMLMRATLWKKWDAKINIGFAGGTVSLKDVYLQYNIDENSNVRTGYYLEPFGIEQTESSKTTKFMHVSSTVEAFRPGRNIGITYNRWADMYNLSVGLFGGDANNKSNGDESIGLTSRLVFSPSHEEGSIAHFGLSGTYRWAGEDGVDSNGDPVKEIRYRSRAATHIENRRFIDAKIQGAETEFKYGVEAIIAMNKFSFQAEYIHTKVDFDDSDNYYYSNYSDKEYVAYGWYAQLGYLLKGGNYKYKMKAARLSKPGPGSLEVLFRINSTELEDLDVNILGGYQTDYTLGCTWYINHNILTKLNFTRVNVTEGGMNYVSGAGINGINDGETFNMIQTRLQFSF